MTDIEFDERFLVTIGETGNVSLIEGTKEYEQKLVLTIMDNFFERIGDRNTTNIVSKLRLLANRAVEENEYVESIEDVNVLNQEGDTLRLEIIYNRDSNIEFEVI